jgi:prepilin-type N-terminal cleavage/methylation domain-containing protein/prepilin-type processing-associated H-X9-DG protein
MCQRELVMKNRGFTLIELLVVIAIIALLLSIIIPALNRSKELARRLVCLNHLKNIGLANILYAEAHDGWYVPIMDLLIDGTRTDYEWPHNDAFRDLLGYVDAESDPEGDWEQWHAPRDFLCPSDKVAVDRIEDELYTNWISYGGNITDWYQNWMNIMYAGHREIKIKNPSRELSFSESNDWWMWWLGADYVTGWDVLGHDTIMPYKYVGCDGPTLYRHSEGANLLFYDGHVEWWPKERVFVIEDWDAARPGIWSIFSEYPPPIGQLETP